MQMEKMASWADDVEEEVAAGTHDPAGPPPVIHEDFPSLAQAAKVPAKPAPKKAKGKKLNLADLMAAPEPASTRPAFGASRRDAPMSEREILMSLPTASRGKVEGEVEERGMGGAFNQYGGDRERGGGFGRRDDRRGRGDGDDERDFPPPSRADEVQDWGANRQFQPSGAPPGFGGGPRRGDRGGDRDAGPGAGFRDREPRPYSAADDVNDWGTTKKFEPSHDDRARGGFGGFREGPPRDGPARRPGPGFDDRPMNRADQEDQWSRGREFQQAGPPGPRGTSGSRNFGFEDRAPRTSNLDAEERWGKRQADLEATAAPGPAASTTERPRLKLQPRTLPVEAPVASTPAPEEDAAPTPAASAPGPAPKRSSNPFGAARPREEVLKEKGIDPKQQDELLLHPPPAAKVEPSTAAAPQEAEPATAAQAPAFVSVEGPAELEAKARIAALENDLQALKDEGDADEEDISEIATAIEHETAKLAELKLEREQAEEKARQALANGELDSGSWVPATTKHHKAAPAAAAPAAPAALHTPGTANGAGEKRGWGPAAGERKSPAGPGAAGRSGGRGPHHEGAPARGSPEGQRPAGPRVVAAGAPNVERKW